MYRHLLFAVLAMSCVDARDDRRFRYNYNNDIGGWIKLHEIPANWFEARKRCHLEGGILASPINNNFKQVMMSLMVKSNSVFTGIHSTLSKGDYFSIEGIPLRNIPHNWTEMEPDNYKDKESCLVMLPTGKFLDEDCSCPLRYMCYKKKTAGMFVNECGTVDREYVLDPRTGSCYKFHREPRSWSEAYMACAAEEAHLAVINSDVESNVIKDIFAKNPEASILGAFGKRFAHIGFLGWGKQGDWVTIHGQTLAEAGYAKFSAGEPNNSSTGEYCGSVFRTGLLNDVWCENSYTSICEKAPLHSNGCVYFEDDWAKITEQQY